MSGDTKKHTNDFATDQEVRWCPGCGDYAILKALQKTFDYWDNRNKEITKLANTCPTMYKYLIEHIYK